MMEPFQHVEKQPVGQIEPELPRRDLLDGMSFVEDHRVETGKIRLSRRDIRKEKIVIHDEKLGREPFPARLLKRADLPERAFISAADIRIALYLFPQRWGDIDIVTGERFPFLEERADFIDLILFVEKKTAAADKKLEPFPAGIVRAAEADRIAEIYPVMFRNDFIYEGKVFVDKLLLEGLRLGRNCENFPLTQTVEKRGDEIRDGFTRSGSGFDEYDPAGRNGTIYERGHFLLLPPVLEKRKDAVQASFTAENIIHADSYSNLNEGYVSTSPVIYPAMLAP
jgi:hypothetical protein